MQLICLMSLGASVAQSSEPFTSAFVGPILATDSYVNALAKVVGFLGVLRFPATGKVDRVG